MASSRGLSFPLRKGMVSTGNQIVVFWKPRRPWVLYLGVFKVSTVVTTLVTTGQIEACANQAAPCELSC